MVQDSCRWRNNNYTHPAYTARSLNTTGAQVLDILTTDAIGSVTNATTRTMTLAELGYTGATNANYITNNNQLANGAGYTTSSNDRVYISDTRGAARAPSYYDDRYAQWDFQNTNDTGVGGDGWHALLTVSKWSSYNSSHRQEQLIFSGDHLWRRTATSDAGWGTSKKIWDSGNDGSGSGLDADTVDGIQGASMMQLTATQTITGQNYFRSDRDTTSNSPPLQAYSSGGGGAIMSFHRGGYYAINFGLDSDNVIRMGGWSAATNRFQMDMSGNLTMAGNITAYSDIRLKENIKVIPDALSKVQQLRGVTFTRNDTEDLEKLHTGVIAQEVEAVLPEAVSEDNDGIKNVAYGNMVGLLIEAIKEQQTQIEELKALVQTLVK